MTPQSLKRMYGHTLTGMAREMKPMETWPEMSEGALTALADILQFLNAAAELLAGNFEAGDELEYVSIRLEDLTYAALPGQGQQIVRGNQEEVLHIRVELGYV